MFTTIKGELTVMITPPIGEFVILQDFVPGNIRLNVKSSQVKLPYKSTRNEEIKFSYEFIPENVGLETVVLYFRGKVRKHYLIHPLKFTFNVSRHEFDLNLPPNPTHYYLDETEDFSLVLWFTNSLQKLVRFKDINVSFSSVEKVFPWKLEASAESLL